MPVIDTSVLLPFILASLVIILSPGADTFSPPALCHPRWAVSRIAAMAGILAGLSLVSLLLISGMGLLVSQVPFALGVVNILGIAVLLVLTAIRHESGPEARSRPVDSSSAVSDGSDKPFRMSLITNVTNPKVLIFYVAFFPSDCLVVFIAKSQTSERHCRIEPPWHADGRAPLCG
jgi:threonine/homoserine/homoserine lactone efflux protein